MGAGVRRAGGRVRRWPRPAGRRDRVGRSVDAPVGPGRGRDDAVDRARDCRPRRRPCVVQPAGDAGAVLRRVRRVGAAPARRRARAGIVVRGRRRTRRPVDVATGAPVVPRLAPPARADRPVRALPARSGGELSGNGNRSRRGDVLRGSPREEATVTDTPAVDAPPTEPTEPPATDAAAAAVPPSAPESAWAGPAADSPPTQSGEVPP